MTDGTLCATMIVPLSGGFFCVPFWDTVHALTLREVFNGSDPEFYQEVPIT